MKSPAWIPILFALVALYDALLGLLFLFAPQWPYQHFNIPPPNHFGYVQFPAALLLIFALMFLRVAADAVRRRELIIYGILLKLAYVSVSAWYWLKADIPFMWKPFTVIDAVTVLLFAVAFASLGSRKSQEPGS
jgi:hypothetical protein